MRNSQISDGSMPIYYCRRPVFRDTVEPLCTAQYEHVFTLEVMDIHRCRFVPYPPSAINALAFSHPSSIETPGKGPATLRLAVGRANGDIEVWNPLKGAWFQESILRGGKDRSIEGLAWIQDPDDEDKNGWKVPGKLRLFSIGYSTAVTEWDLLLGRPVQHSGGNHGEAWCLAAQPRWQAPKKSTEGTTKAPAQERGFRGQHLVVGCADGSVVLLSTADGELRYLRTLTRPSKKRARVLSITFQDRDTIVAGYADSTIRIIDMRNGQEKKSMSLGAGPREGPKEILVWSVRCLPDGNIVSGDSAGEVKFWDGRNYTLLQRVKGHDADILDVVTSADGNTVVSGGMDRRTTVYRQVGGSNKGDRRRWVKILHRRYHAHDVKTMAAYETKGISVLASGGLDTTPIITPLRELEREYHRSLSSLPQLPQLVSAPSKRLMMSWWDQEVSLWRLVARKGREFGDEDGEKVTDNRPRKLVARIAVKGEENVASTDLAADGGVLAVATVAETKMFNLRQRRMETDDLLKVQKIDLPQTIAKSGGKLVKFSPDARWCVVVRPENSIQVCRLTRPGAPKESPHILPKVVDLRRLHRDPIAPKLQHGSLGNYDRSISRIAFSADSRILVVGDLSGYLDSWVLEGHEDLTQQDDEQEDDARSATSSDDNDSDEESHPLVILGQHWIRNPVASLLPKLGAAPLVLSFRPSKASPSSALSNGNTVVHPTRRNPHPHSHDLPNGEDRLIALTCEHQIYEFGVLSGRLSEWSRRNPTASWPTEFRQTRDRAMGLVWDIDLGKQRIWVYGSSWLWMFNLSMDFPPAVNEDSRSEEEDVNNTTEANKLKRKRKREQKTSEVQDPRKHNSGAGSKIPSGELDVGFGRRYRKTKNGLDPEASRWTSIDGEPTPASDEDEGDDAVNGSSLARLRRGLRDDGQTNGGGSVVMDVDDPAFVNGDMAIVRKEATDGPAYWHTLKYRPIMGVVPIGGGTDAARQALDQSGDYNKASDGVEVALVERPMWDVELPPRYNGDQEWDK